MATSEWKEEESTVGQSSVSAPISGRTAAGCRGPLPPLRRSLTLRSPLDDEKDAH